MTVDDDSDRSQSQLEKGNPDDPAARRAVARKLRQVRSGTAGKKKGLGLTRRESEQAREMEAGNAFELTVHNDMTDSNSEVPEGTSNDVDDPLAAMRDPRRRLWLGAGIAATTLLVLLAFTLPAGQAANGKPAPTWAIWAIVLLSLLLGGYIFAAERRYDGLYQAATAKLLAIGRSKIQAADVEAFQEASSALTSGLPLSETLQIILSAAVQLLEGNEGSIMLLDPEDDHLETVCYRGNPERYEPFAKIAMGEGIAGRVAESRKGLAISGPADPEQFQGLVDKKVTIDSSICVPLIATGRLIGVLSVNDTVGGRGFDEGDLTTLQVFADDAAAAILHSAGLR